MYPQTSRFFSQPPPAIAGAKARVFGLKKNIIYLDDAGNPAAS
jgi:hypothetical protein